MKRKLLVIDSLNEQAESVLDRHRRDIAWEIISSDALAQKLPDAHFLITRSTARIDRRLIESAKNLRLIVMAGAGIDGIDQKAAKDAGILIMNTQDANSVAAAEMSIGLLLSLIRHIPSSCESLRQGEWEKKGSAELRQNFRGFELAKKSVGIVGLGRVGKRVADRLKAFEMNVIACDPYISKKQAGKYSLVPLESLVETADVISLHIPLTDETRDLIKYSLLKRTTRHPALINTSRGSVVVETDILRALEENLISAYAADVFQQEPLPAGHPFLNHPRILCTPHLGAQTAEAHSAVSLLAVQRVIDFFMTGDTAHALKI